MTKPADCTIGINNIQSRLNLLESELKLDNRIIPRVLWADDELKPNTTDLKPLSLPVIGVIAHHTGDIEHRCFTIGELHNLKRGCVFPMAFRMGQHGVNDHPYKAPQFNYDDNSVLR